MGIGLKEILLILLVAVLVFGASRIPKALGGLGKGIHAFRKGLKGEEPDRAPDDGDGRGN
ncbi:MAG TPA: twin-arginine translocase TatA/TatE family subunit [Myxococcota bacterium]|nr:twin-arginine translocase TatA/TatE family subunit [Myxococcota bacterium]HOC98465.1 twin-arginine translocase TatA/TatE family subunit [Myxococcota bacterium]HOH75927.1 twin-arginine translocase TatA/TatE family subunit [Myxococcota bacterium]